MACDFKRAPARDNAFAAAPLQHASPAMPWCRHLSVAGLHDRCMLRALTMVPRLGPTSGFFAGGAGAAAASSARTTREARRGAGPACAGAAQDERSGGEEGLRAGGLEGRAGPARCELLPCLPPDHAVRAQPGKPRGGPGGAGIEAAASRWLATLTAGQLRARRGLERAQGGHGC